MTTQTMNILDMYHNVTKIFKQRITQHPSIHTPNLQEISQSQTLTKTSNEQKDQQDQPQQQQQ